MKTDAPRGFVRRNGLRLLVATLAALLLGAAPTTAFASTAPSAQGALVAPAAVTGPVGVTGPGVGAGSAAVAGYVAAPGEQAALPVRALSSLPPEATETYRLIESGGPFPYDRDGIVFQNRERILPAKGSGYYHEYTVRTPGSDDRGARRIVTGSADEVYYTGDHYASFVAVDVTR